MTIDHSHLHAAVFSWVAPRLRQLPWRNIRDPWGILVSEVMLQQTTVNRVLGKWQTFMEAFPNPQTCAEAELGDVLRLWQGLGYPRRARNLHICARRIVDDFGGHLPATVEELLTLPGIGPYTARAVVAFAFEGDAAVVDTNVVRVLRRWSGEVLTPARAQGLADAILPEGDAWLWNQALMDLGATVCRWLPLCDECPLQESCRWRGCGTDPAAAGTAARQAPFEGSDRQARGRLMKKLTEGTVTLDDAAHVMGRPQERADILVQALIEEGLIRRSGDHLAL